MGYLGIVALVMFKPLRGLAVLKRHPNQLRFAVVTLIIHSLIAIFKQLLYQFTSQPVVPATWLRVPSGQGWLWSAYLQIPVDFAQAVLFSGIVSLVAPRLGGKGSLAGQFSLYTLAFAPPTVVLMLGTLIASAFPAGAVLFWVLFLGVSLWVIASVCLAVSVEQEWNLSTAIPVAFCALVPSVGLALTYIR